MKNKDLLAEVQRALGGTATLGAAEMALGATLRAIRAGLLEDGEVKLAGFGSFRMKEVAPRRVQVPGEQRFLTLPQRRVVRFSPSALALHKHIKTSSRTQNRLPSLPQMGEDSSRESVSSV